MEKMERTLFIGNGLNLCSGGITWSQLLKRVCPSNLNLGADDTDDMAKCIPQPIKFEIVGSEQGLREHGSGKDPFIQLKKRISAEFKKRAIDVNDLHGRIYGLPVNNIITTNYDYVLERASSKGERFERIGIGSKKYILEATSSIDGIDFFHAHGVYDIASSICIGYEHYMGYIQRLRKMLNSDAEDEDTNHDTDIGAKTPRILSLLDCESTCEKTWPLLMFTTNVAIVGLGLDFSEVDLWWLLSFRSSLITGNCIYQSKIKRNHITFFDVSRIRKGGAFETEEDMKMSGKAVALEGLGVRYVPIARESYGEGYHAVFNILSCKRLMDEYDVTW